MSKHLWTANGGILSSGGDLNFLDNNLQNKNNSQCLGHDNS